MNAIVSILYGDAPAYVKLLQEQHRSLASACYAGEYLCIVADEVPAELVSQLPTRVVRKPSLPVDCWCQDTLKIHAWSLLEYGKILLVDADCTFLSDPSHLFDLAELACLPGTIAPINAARLVIEPAKGTFLDLMEIYARGVDYPFNCGKGFQGILWERFKDGHRFAPALHTIEHVGGGQKR